MCDAQAKAIVGAVGTGKTTACIWEIGFNLPRRIYMRWGIAHTKWIVVRKTYEQLMDTDFQEAMDWFVQGEWRPSRKNLRVKWPASENCPSPLIVDLIFHSCNTPEEEGKFRSMNVTGAWIDEANQLSMIAKNVIKSRLGRFPKKRETPAQFVPRYLVESCNPFPADDIMYTTYDWMAPETLQAPAPMMKCGECGKKFSLAVKCPECGARGEATGDYDWRTGVYNTEKLVKKIPRGGPVPTIPPTPDHIGFWQEQGENEENLRPGYWESIERDYQEAPEMVKLLVKGEPGYKPEGKPVYRNFDKDAHMAKEPLVWKRLRDSYTGEMRGVPLLCGWDFSGNFPAAVLVQRVAPMSYQVLREFYDNRMQAVDFAKWVLESLAVDYPGYEGTHYADPASWAQYSDKGGGFTSNAMMVQEQCEIIMTASRNELDLRISAVDQLLIRRGGFLVDPRCFMVLNGFVGGYVREENVRMGNNEYKDQPKKNKFSHVHDALQYCVVTEIYPKVKEPRPEIAEDEELISSFPDRMTAYGAGPVNRKILRDSAGVPLEPTYSQSHGQAAKGWDPRRRKGA